MIYYTDLPHPAGHDYYWFFDGSKIELMWLSNINWLSMQHQQKPRWAENPAMNADIHELIRIIWQAKVLNDKVLF